MLIACQAPPNPPQAAFYHWQTRFELTDIEHEYLKDLEVNKIYFKCFDVDWKNGPYPMAIAQLATDLDGYELVPTIFITNRTLLEISPAELPDLAQKIAQKIEQILPQTAFQEVQFDCDWSEETQEKYFELLRLLSRQFEAKILSATIRLHQIKFFQRTGVPPVDKGMLMCYNVGKIEHWTSANSILDTNIVPQYLEQFDRYPLHLDVALPVFQWGLLFRAEKLHRIFNNLQATDLEDSLRFRKLRPNRYEVIKSTYLNGHYLYEGERIRLEGCSQAALLTTARALAEHLPPVSRYITFYHLDTTTIQQHSYEDLEAILDEF